MPLDLSRLAFCSWSVQPDSIDDVIRAAQAVGVHAVQLHLNPLSQSPEAWADTKARLDDAGIALFSGMITTTGEDYSTFETIRETGGFVPDEHWAQNLQDVRLAAEQAKALGLQIVTTHAGFVPHEPGAQQDKLAHRLTQVADTLADHGQQLLLETGQESADGLLAFLTKLNHDNVGVNFDPANMILYGMGDPIAALEILMPHVGQVHLKDATPSDTPGTWGTEVPLGEGAVDWPAFFALLQKHKPDVRASIEREAGEQRIQDIKQAARLATGQG